MGVDVCVKVGKRIVARRHHLGMSQVMLADHVSRSEKQGTTHHQKIIPLVSPPFFSYLRTFVRMNTPLEPLTVTQSRGAFMAGLSLGTFQQLLKTKQIPSRRVGRRVLVEVEAIKAFLRQDSEADSA